MQLRKPGIGQMHPSQRLSWLYCFHGDETRCLFMYGNFDLLYLYWIYVLPMGGVYSEYTLSIDRVPKWAWLQVAVTSRARCQYSDDVT